MEFYSKNKGDFRVTYEGIAAYTGGQYDIMEGRGNSPKEALEDLKNNGLWENTYIKDTMRFYIGKKEVSRKEFEEMSEYNSDKRVKTKAMKQVQKDFPRWILESTTNGTGFNLVHQFWVGGDLHLKVEEMWDEEGEYLGYSEPYCLMN